MNTQRIRDAYFEWMGGLVCSRASVREESGHSLGRLFRYLNEREFTYSHPRDANRAADGIDLRHRFAYERGYSTRDTLIALGETPCSVLEMLVALAVRCENIMYDPAFGNRSGLWFKNMLMTLGIDDMYDIWFDPEHVKAAVDLFLNREYREDGRGGLFIVEDPPQDMRKTEIWYQMMWYLNSFP